MNGRDEVSELGSLLRSLFPIILIESHEEPRILVRLDQDDRKARAQQRTEFGDFVTGVHRAPFIRT